MELKTWGSIFWNFLSITSGKQARLQNRAFKEVDLWCFLYVTARVWYYKKEIHRNHHRVRQKELDKSNGKKYKIEEICESVIYTSKLKSHLPGFYFLVLKKSYFKNKNTQEPALTMLYFCKIISFFYHDNLDKPIAISSPIDYTSLITKLVMKPRIEGSSIKQKQSQLAKANCNKKHIKKSYISSFLYCILALSQ